MRLHDAFHPLVGLISKKGMRPRRASWSSLILPGWVQWCEGRPGYGGGLASAYATSLTFSLLFWGSPSALGFLFVAVACQTIGWMDVVRRIPITGLTPTSVLAAAGVAMSLAVHTPMIGLLSLVAWPGRSDDPFGGSYLVNRLAYRDHRPSPGEWIWADLVGSSSQRAARVLAAGGQDVEWDGDAWRVDGIASDFGPARAFAKYPKPLKFRVPEGQYLIWPDAPIDGPVDLAPIMFVDAQDITGRAWARYAPFRESRLL